MLRAASPAFGGVSTTGRLYQQTNTGVNVAATGWHLVTYRIDVTTQRSYVYIDGSVAATASFTGSPVYTNGPDTYIGKHGNGQTGFGFNGTMDEVRFSAASRSDDWIKTEYQTQLLSAQGAPASPVPWTTPGSSSKEANSSSISNTRCR